MSAQTLSLDFGIVETRRAVLRCRRTDEVLLALNIVDGPDGESLIQQEEQDWLDTVRTLAIHGSYLSTETILLDADTCALID
jgi:hypothetical protein